MQGVLTPFHAVIVDESLRDEGSLSEELAFLFDDLAADVDLDGEFGSVLCERSQ